MVQLALETYNPKLVDLTYLIPRLHASRVSLSNDPSHAASTPRFPAEGIPTDHDRGEARHQALERIMTSSCRPPSDVLPDREQKRNAALALQVVREGRVYKSQVYNPRPP